jgi:DNA helicase II / ATP-dependent DNA helicase PcrA
MLPEIILGPPGTGKTTTLLNIVDQELNKGTPPERMAYVSFTRRAAEEAIERALKKFDFNRNRFPYFRTIHSLCFHTLGMRSTEVFQGKHIKDFAEWMGITITGRWSEDGTFSGFTEGDRIIFLENLARIKCVPLRDLYNLLETQIRWSELERVVRGLKKFKEERGLYDFSDMLELFLLKGYVPPLEILLCDEAQDQSTLQWRVIEKLASEVNRVIIAGDDDQGIHEWCGGDIKRIIEQPGHVQVLGQSYRVPKNIQTLANNVISRVKVRRPKEWQARTGDKGEIVRISSLSQADLSGDDILILVRNTYLLKEMVEPELQRNGYLYSHNGRLSVSESLIRAIVAWESLRMGDSITYAEALNLYTYFTVGISVVRGHKKLPNIEVDNQIDYRLLCEKGGLLVAREKIWHEALERVAPEQKRYIIAARRRGERLLGLPRIRISTIHGAKGGQADHVILFKEVARKTFREMDVNPDSEHRVFYVGVSRSKQKLTIVESSNERSYPYL